MKLKCHIHTSGLSCPLVAVLSVLWNQFCLSFSNRQIWDRGHTLAEWGEETKLGRGEEGGGGAERERGREDCFTKRATSLYLSMFKISEIETKKDLGPPHTEKRCMPNVYGEKAQTYHVWMRGLGPSHMEGRFSHDIWMRSLGPSHMAGRFSHDIWMTGLGPSHMAGRFSHDIWMTGLGPSHMAGRFSHDIWMTGLGPSHMAGRFSHDIWMTGLGPSHMAEA